jgi:hypothetical protein
MYPWVTHTWNPIRGRCPHECVYCYYQANARYEKSVGPLRLSPTCLMEPLKRGCRKATVMVPLTIFVGSSTDMWAQAVPDSWIEAVLEHCNRYPDNTYVFQTKNPARFRDFFFQLPSRTMLGATIETNFYLPHHSDKNLKEGMSQSDTVLSKAPSPASRANALASLRGMADAGRKVTLFVSIEPILDFDLSSFATNGYPPDLPHLIRLIEPVFVSIGADSKGHAKAGRIKEPTARQVEELIKRLSIFTEVRLKPNLQRIIGRRPSA